MKYPVIIIMVVAILASAAMPAYADKRAENNAKIAEFVLDTIKFPLVLLGSFVGLDHQKAKEEVKYQEHKGLSEALR